MTGSTLVGRASEGMVGTLRDLAILAAEFLRPTLVTPATAADMRAPAFPGLPGVVPGVGRFDDCSWGLGVEIRADKTPHWTGRANSPLTFGHFGGAGTFLWVDPELGLAVACLTDRAYGPWALEAWPPFSDALIQRHSRGQV
jgi:CubicO group peptidase (beta-lactamase class C family)